MRLLNVPPVKPGQRFRFSEGTIEYLAHSVQWEHTWQEWEVDAEVLEAGTSVLSRVGEVSNFFIWRDDVLEILNDEQTTAADSNV